MKSAQLLCLATALLFFSQHSTAENQALLVEYASAPWNRSASKVDSAHIFVKKKGSSRLVKVLVEETAPDSSLFQGKFSIDFDDQSVANAVEVYVPPLEMRADEKSMQAFSGKVNKGEVQPSPALVRNEDGAHQIDVYDTESQLQTAQGIQERKQVAVEMLQEAEKAEPPADSATTKGSELVNEAAQIASVAAQAVSKEALRLRQSQLEAQRRALQKQRMAELSQAAQEEKKMKASDLARRGLEAYDAGNYPLAERLFGLSIQMDPTDDSFYFMYGVSLYRNENLDKALIYLRQADGDIPNNIERLYYMGLIHYRLNEYGPAAEYFRSVQITRAPVLAPSSAFYLGVSEMVMDNLDAASAAFQWVLDNSQDPALDRRAEEYLEKIASILQNRRVMARKWIVNARGGVGYDSNILLTPDNGDSSTSTASDEGGARLLLMGDATRYLRMRESYDWSTKFATTYLYSIDSDFSRADPWQNTLSLIYNRKGAGEDKKAYAYSIKPFYQNLFMDAESTGTRENVLNTFGVSNDFTFYEKAEYYVLYGFSLQKDDSLLDSSTGDEDADAMLYTFKNSHTLFLDKARKRAVLTNINLSYNDAAGKNKLYYKVEAGATYMAPFERWKDSTWSAGLTAYKLRYPDADDGRRDTNITLTTTLTKNLNRKWSATGLGTYSSNTSNVASSHYSKFTAMVIGSYNWSDK